jgi:hypothetical protein
VSSTLVWNGVVTKTTPSTRTSWSVVRTTSRSAAKAGGVTFERLSRRDADDVAPVFGGEVREHLPRPVVVDTAEHVRDPLANPLALVVCVREQDVEGVLAVQFEQADERVPADRVVVVVDRAPEPGLVTLAVESVEDDDGLRPDPRILVGDGRQRDVLGPVALVFAERLDGELPDLRVVVTPGGFRERDRHGLSRVAVGERDRCPPSLFQLSVRERLDRGPLPGGRARVLNRPSAGIRSVITSSCETTVDQRMPRADLTIDLPEGVWVGDLSRSYPDTTFRILSAFPDGDSGYGLLEINSEDLDEILDRMRAHEAVQSLETVQRVEDRAVVQFETNELPLLLTIQRAQIPLEPPLELVGGEITLHLTAPRDRISAFADQLEALSIPYSLDRIYGDVELSTPLTDTQRELLIAALERGYYDTPRRITLTELAAELGMASSTVSETLHRAEEIVLKEYCAGEPSLDVDVDHDRS